MLSDFRLIESKISLGSGEGHLINSPGVRNIIRAMIVAEDRRYCSHRGVDLRGVARAITKLLTEKKIQGASTIEQQFVRTARGRYEITISRKVTECVLAVAISSRHSKLTTAFSYLEIAYFGWGANGIHQAAERLGVDLREASKHESAALAAMLKVPMPRFPSERYVARHTLRVDYILKNWEEVERRNGFTF